MKLLIVEDDNEINHMIKDYFELHNYQTSQAFSGTEAILLMGRGEFDAIILDLMLPGKSGEEVIGSLKKLLDIPVIAISAKDKDQASVEMLKLGADDFLAKPFNIEELYLRVEKNIQLYRRILSNDEQTNSISFGNLEISEAKREAKLNHQLIKLTGKEFDILLMLMKSPHQVFTKDKILEIVWQDDVEVDTNSVAVHISNLRKKIGTQVVIKTIWGIGFKLELSL